MGVLPSDMSGPHWLKRNCLWPHKYIMQLMNISHKTYFLIFLYWRWPFLMLLLKMFLHSLVAVRAETVSSRAMDWSFYKNSAAFFAKSGEVDVQSGFFGGNFTFLCLLERCLCVNNTAPRADNNSCCPNQSAMHILSRKKKYKVQMRCSSDMVIILIHRNSIFIINGTRNFLSKDTWQNTCGLKLHQSRTPNKLE